MGAIGCSDQRRAAPRRVPQVAPARCAGPSGMMTGMPPVRTLPPVAAVVALALAAMSIPATAGNKESTAAPSKAPAHAAGPAMGGAAHVPGAAGGAHIPGAAGGVHIPGAAGGAHIPGAAGGAHVPGAAARAGGDRGDAHLPSNLQKAHVADKTHEKKEAEDKPHREAEASRETEREGTAGRDRKDRPGAEHLEQTRAEERERSELHERTAERDREFSRLHERDFHVHDVRHFTDRERERWREGRWRHAWHDGHPGWWYAVGPHWYYYQEPVLPYPFEVAPVIVEERVIVQEQTTSAPRPNDPPGETRSGPADPAPPLRARPNVVYHCGNPEGFYPGLSACSAGWEEVAAGPSVRND